jgi:LysM repeat protein
VDKLKDLSADDSGKGISRNDITAAQERINTVAYAQTNFDKLDGNGDSYVTVKEIDRYIRISGNDLSASELSKLETLKQQLTELKEKHLDMEIMGVTRHDLLDAMEELGSGSVRYGEPVEEAWQSGETSADRGMPPEQVEPPTTSYSETYGDKPNEAVEKTHSVVRGDSLWKICKQELRQRSGGDEPRNAEILEMVNEMARLNNLTDKNLIRPGEILKIPHAASSNRAVSADETVII